MIGVDLGKRSFQLHGVRADGSAAFRRKVSRDGFLEAMSKHGTCKVAMEACGGAHHWSRALRSMGFEVRLVPPAYVKPFMKRQKNEAADAEASCEAASRPTMRFVAVKSAERQAEGMLFRTRDLPVKQRTQIINALRGHLAEHGVTPPQVIVNMARLGAALEAPEARLPDAVRELGRLLRGEIGIRSRAAQTSARRFLPIARKNAESGDDGLRLPA